MNDRTHASRGVTTGRSPEPYLHTIQVGKAFGLRNLHEFVDESVKEIPLLFFSPLFFLTDPLLGLRSYAVIIGVMGAR